MSASDNIPVPKTVFEDRVLLNQRSHALDDFVVKNDLFVKGRSVVEDAVIKDAVIKNNLVIKENLKVSGTSRFLGNVNVTGDLTINGTKLQDTLNTMNAQITNGNTDINCCAEQLNHLDGVTSNVQEQLTSFQEQLTNVKDQVDAFEGQSATGISGVTTSATELNILHGARITTEQLNYLDGVTNNVQEQLDGVTSNCLLYTSPSPRD